MAQTINVVEAFDRERGGDGQSCLQTVQNLSNNQLTLHIKQLNVQKHVLDAEFILHLGEFDRRKLFRECACSSLFEFLVVRLGFSEDTAYKRVWGARMLREYPLVYDLLRDGRIHLSGMLLIRPHLSAENHRDWLVAVAGKSKREVEKLIATRCPKPDSPSRIRKLPARAQRSSPSPDEPSPSASFLGGAFPGTIGATIRSTSISDASSSDASSSDPSIADPSIADPSIADPSISDPSISDASISDESTRIVVAKGSSATASSLVDRRPKIQPLSSHSYRVVFTATEELKEKISRASALLSHAIPSNDLPALIERALDALIQSEERRRFGATRKHGKKPAQRPAQNIKRNSGYIPASVRRAVWQRDGGQCGYVNDVGERCSCKHYLQFDHRVPRALGGTSTIDNVRLRCAAHNALAAELVFGADRVASAVVSAKARRVNPRPIGEVRIPDH